MPFKMHKIIYFFDKKTCVPDLQFTYNFQTCYPNHTYFYMALAQKGGASSTLILQCYKR